MSRFERVWAGEREPRLRSLPSPSITGIDSAVAGPIAERFARYVQERQSVIPATATHLDLDRLKVRLCDRLSKELIAAGQGRQRGMLLTIFAEALDAIRERELEIEPPDLVERVVVREPQPTATLSPQQAMGLFVDEG